MVPGHDRRRAAMRAPPFGERTQRLFAGAFGMTEDAADLDLEREIARGPRLGAAFGEQQIDFGGTAADDLEPGERLDRVLVVGGQMIEIESDAGYLVGETAGLA